VTGSYTGTRVISRPGPGTGGFILAGSLAGAVSGLTSPGFTFAVTAFTIDDLTVELLASSAQMATVGFFLFIVTLPVGIVLGTLAGLLTAVANRWGRHWRSRRFLVWTTMCGASASLSVLCGWPFLPTYLWAVPSVLIGAGALRILERATTPTLA